MLNAESIAMSLDKPRRNGNGKYIACCPAHDDKNPSLAITDANNTTLVYCFSGCQQINVIEALRARGLWPDTKREANNAPYFSPTDLLEMHFYVEIENTGGLNLSPDDEVKLAAYRQVLLSHGVTL